MRCLVVEDEPLAASKLVALLRSEPWISEVLTAATVADAAVAIRDHAPELLVLDVQLPDGSSLSLLANLPYEPLIVFTTAFDSFAVNAFEVQALDYLVKPFSGERFRTALERVRRARAAKLLGDSASERVGVVTTERPITDRVFVRVGRGLIPLALADVEQVEGHDDHARFWVGNRSYLLYQRLGDLESLLERAGFVRVHRSHIVNRAKVEKLTPNGDGRLVITLTSGATVVSSKSRTADARRLLTQT